MGLDVIALHVALALALFLVLNWIGKHAETQGYLTLNLFLKRDEAPAFNLLFRIFGPIIFIILAASLLYAANLDRYDRLAESIIYSILIYEGFNRPPAVRLLERLLFPWGSKSLGPMQVTTDRRISDEESVTLGAKRLVDAYREVLATGNEKARLKNVTFDSLLNIAHRYYVISRVAAAYNKDDSYVGEVRELHELMAREFYPELIPPPTRMSDNWI